MAHPACWQPSWQPPCLYHSWSGWRGRSWSDTLSARPQSHCNKGSMKKEKKERERENLIAFNYPALWPHIIQLPKRAATNKALIAISTANKGSPLSINSRPSLLHSTSSSSCTAGTVNCIRTVMKQRKSSSLTGKMWQKREESNPGETRIGGRGLIWLGKVLFPGLGKVLDAS